MSRTRLKIVHKAASNSSHDTKKQINSNFSKLERIKKLSCISFEELKEKIDKTKTLINSLPENNKKKNNEKEEYLIKISQFKAYEEEKYEAGYRFNYAIYLHNKLNKIKTIDAIKNTVEAATKELEQAAMLYEKIKDKDSEVEAKTQICDFYTILSDWLAEPATDVDYSNDEALLLANEYNKKAAKYREKFEKAGPILSNKAHKKHQKKFNAHISVSHHLPLSSSSSSSIPKSNLQESDHEIEASELTEAHQLPSYSPSSSSPSLSTEFGNHHNVSHMNNRKTERKGEKRTRYSIEDEKTPLPVQHVENKAQEDKEDRSQEMIIETYHPQNLSARRSQSQEQLSDSFEDDKNIPPFKICILISELQVISRSHEDLINSFSLYKLEETNQLSYPKHFLTSISKLCEKLEDTFKIFSEFSPSAIKDDLIREIAQKYRKQAKMIYELDPKQLHKNDFIDFTNTLRKLQELLLTLLQESCQEQENRMLNFQMTRGIFPNSLTAQTAVYHSINEQKRRVSHKEIELIQLEQKILRLQVHIEESSRNNRFLLIIEQLRLQAKLTTQQGIFLYFYSQLLTLMTKYILEFEKQFKAETQHRYLQPSTLSNLNSSSTNNTSLSSHSIFQSDQAKHSQYCDKLREKYMHKRTSSISFFNQAPFSDTEENEEIMMDEENQLSQLNSA